MMMRTLLALIVTLLALATPALAQPLGDAGTAGDVDAIGGMHIRELKDEYIEDRLACGGADASGALPLGVAVALVGWSVRRRRVSGGA